MMISLVTHESSVAILRGSVVLISVHGVYSLLRALRHMPLIYRPHVVMIAVWMTVTAGCMSLLAAGYSVVYVFEALNVGSLFLIGSWVTFLTRITRDIRTANEGAMD